MRQTVCSRMSNGSSQRLAGLLDRIQGAGGGFQRSKTTSGLSAKMASEPIDLAMTRALAEKMASAR